MIAWSVYLCIAIFGVNIRICRSQSVGCSDRAVGP
jgi:hypothetical protein